MPSLRHSVNATNRYGKYINVYRSVLNFIRSAKRSGTCSVVLRHPGQGNVFFFRKKWQISSSSSESESFNHGADVRKYSDYEREVQLSSECVYAKRSLLVSR